MTQQINGPNLYEFTGNDLHLTHFSIHLGLEELFYV